ncbi:MAG: choice-of-anchor tandem repeat GloVer-containing protein [Spirosomataceae bacterium]
MRKKCYALFLSLLCSLPSVAQPLLVGVTGNGGSSYGTVFTMPVGGTSITQQFNLNSTVTVPGKNPQFNKLTQADNGKLYGFTQGGADGGILFEYDPVTAIYTKKVEFNRQIGNGPTGYLVKASNGKLYGLTSSGGPYYLRGILFEFDPSTSIYTPKYYFGSSSIDGTYPTGALVLANNGKLYGMTSGGGVNDNGTIFEYDLATNTYTKKFDFSYNTSGRPVQNALMQASNGKLYGMTSSGGSNGMGTLFEYDYQTNTFTKQVDFTGTSNGSYPYGDLMQASNGKLYGVTSEGGAGLSGVLFEYEPSTNTFAKKLDFNALNGITGRYPNNSLIEVGNKLYGVTNASGANDNGVLFEYDFMLGSYTKKSDFNKVITGKAPSNSLMQASNGKVYGMTRLGGINDMGTIFEYEVATNTLTKKVDLQGYPLGYAPSGTLARFSQSKFYGLTSIGGNYDVGVLFEYDALTNTYEKKIDFNGAESMQADGALIKADNELWYGVSSYGAGGGSLFEYDAATNVARNRTDFYTQFSSIVPQGPLLKATNGKLYGVVRSGGSNNKGILFEFDPTTNITTKKIDFDGNNGSSPVGSLIQLKSNGKLHGITQNGGTYNWGVLYEYDIATNTLTKKLDFNGYLNGGGSGGKLIEAANGKLYGITAGGGSNGYGVLFEYNPVTDTYIKKVDIDKSDLGNASPLMQASNGKLYGMTTAGGANDFGTLFEYDIATNTYIKKFDFTSSQGRPGNGGLVEVDLCNYSVSASASSSQTCIGVAINLSGSGGNSYSWAASGGAFTSTTGSPTAWSGSTSGTYSVTVSALNNTCTNTATLTLSVIPAPTVTASSNSAIYEGQPLSLSATGGTTYSWSGPRGFSTTEANPTRNGITTALAGIYSVTATASTSCTGSATTSVVVNASPTLSSNSPACVGGTLQLSTNATGSIQWSGPRNFSSTSKTPQITNIQLVNAGIYTLRSGSGSNTITQTISVVVNASPTASVSTNSPVCTGNTLNLSAAGGSTYSWSGPNGFSSSSQNVSIVASSTAGGRYSVTVGSVSSCTASASTSVVVNISPVVTASNTGPVCAGATSLSLKATVTGTGLKFSWTKSGGGYSSTLQNPVISNPTVSSSGVYQVVVSAGTCTASSSTSVVVNESPSVTLTPSNNQSICSGGSVTYSATASGGVSYQWYNGTTAIGGATASTYVANQTGSYKVEVTNGGGCKTQSGTSTLTVNAAPTPVATQSVTGTSTKTIKLNVTPNNMNYVWTGPANFNSTVRNPSIANATTANNGVYSVKVTPNTSTCTATATVSVSVGTAARLAVSEQAEGEVQMSLIVSPNPTQGELNVKISLPEPSEVLLSLWDSQGRQVGKWQLLEHAKEHDTNITFPSTLPGLYFLQAEAPQGRVVKKVVKME